MAACVSDGEVYAGLCRLRVFHFRDGGVGL